MRHLNISDKMKVICAGFPKTGTKSMHRALEELGYSVHDIEEHLQVNELCLILQKSI